MSLTSFNSSAVRARRFLLYWFVFFLISAGLGYPTLNRYDPRQLGPDQQTYYRMVTGEVQPDETPFNVRILVPSIARPIYALTRGQLRTWNPVAFGLLVSNSLFTASTALLLLLCSLRVVRSLAIAQLASTLFLLNFAVVNLWLSAMVDSAEGCLMTAVTWSLLSGRWWLLPLLGILGGMAKQSFLPFSVLFVTVWWLALEKEQRRQSQFVAIAGLALSAFASLVITNWRVTGHFMWPWAMASEWNGGHYGANLVLLLKDYGFWYPFAWLLPLGIWRLKRLPRPWIFAVGATVVFTLALAVYAELAGNANRPIFNLAGPILSLSAALLLGEDQAAKKRVVSETYEAAA